MHKASIPHDALVFVGDGTRVLFVRNRGTIQKPGLAVEIADAPYRLARPQQFQRLIVVAPPKALGTLLGLVAGSIRRTSPGPRTQGRPPISSMCSSRSAGSSYTRIAPARSSSSSP